ncbi:MAG: prepilin-type N-terminal cleavage/methylation domain-containing protein [Gammaproteobacteria bacterium]
MLIKYKQTSEGVLSLRKSGGFSLIEMAMVMLILGFLLAGLFTALGESDTNRRRSEAKTQIDNIVEALYGFAQTTGRIPCPAIATSNGLESVRANTSCRRPHGFVPASSLGLQGTVNANNLLTDPWGNPYRYSVSTYPTGPNQPITAFTTVAGTQTQFANNGLPAGDANLLCVSAEVACGAPILTDIAPALVYSMGEDFGLVPSTTYQEENASQGVAGFLMATDNNFVTRDYAAEGANQFDDILVWMSVNTLNSRLIAAGKLP